MLEMWDLYNGKREKTGKVLPRGVPVPKGLYHLTVSAWIVNSQGQYLLSRRHPQKNIPALLGMYGRFCPCGGGQPEWCGAGSQRRIRDNSESVQSRNDLSDQKGRCPGFL